MLASAPYRSSCQPLLGIKLAILLPRPIVLLLGGSKFEGAESKTCVEVIGTVHFSIPCNFSCRRHSALLTRALALARRHSKGGLRFEKDMFENDHSEGNDQSSTDVINDDEEDVNLVPRQWRILQEDLHKSKSEKKLHARIRARENEVQRAEELQLKREQLEAAGKVLKERIRQKCQGTGSDLVSKKEDTASLIPTSFLFAPTMREGDGLSEAHESLERKTFELDRLFSEDEMACLKRGAPDLTKISNEKWPPLQVLAAAGQFFFLDEYLKSELDLNAVDEDGYTPIHRAILGRKETAVSQLLRAGANPFILDKDGASFLHYSAQTDSLNLVRLFVKYGVDINHPDQDGWTALHVAVITARDDVVRHLLFNGADKHRENKDGRTPFDLCLAVGKGYRTFAVAKSLKCYSKTGSSFDTEPESQEDSTAEEQLRAC
ncbi:hypothetical protein L7F22_045449 [Adiantum nelumboides]|nr:hypothetical protein [Adiantum nelumboides]